MEPIHRLFYLCEIFKEVGGAFIIGEWTFIFMLLGSIWLFLSAILDYFLYIVILALIKITRSTDGKVNIFADNVLMVVTKLALFAVVAVSIDIIGNYLESINPNQSPIHTEVANVIDSNIFTTILRLCFYLVIPVAIGVMIVLIQSHLMSQSRRTFLLRIVGACTYNFMISVIIIILAYTMFWV